MAKKFWTADKIISFAAILISVMTLVVLMYQTNIMREQQRLSVLPYLSINRSGTGTANFSIVMHNNGIGPAFVESTKVRYKGKEYDMDVPNFLYKHVPEMDSIHQLYHSNIYSGMLIPAGKTLNILEIDNSIKDSNKLLKLFSRLLKEGFDFELVYKSIYNERWKLTGAGSTPEKID